jgi:DNA adenine methylase
VTERVDILKAPFPWFGGKRRVADQVWSALGVVDNYIEPFFGSGAVLLARPQWTFPPHAYAETVNDADSYLSNFWRGLASDPDAVAAWCDWPVNETDLFARHLWLVNEGKKRIEQMESDPDFYDAKVAGWWVWGINQWIGSGWCSGSGPWQRPHLGTAGQGVNRQRPHLGTAGQGVNRQRPHLGTAGQGVNRQRPPSKECDVSALQEYFQSLASRLRSVRVCCGDWARIVTEGATAHGNTVGVFLDPPYLGDVRTRDLYRVDDHSISTAVRDWAVARGDDPRMRIVLAGYYEEHAGHVPASWREVRYSAHAAYQTANGGGENAANRHNECLWFSPHCLAEGGLFA